MPSDITWSIEQVLMVIPVLLWLLWKVWQWEGDTITLSEKPQEALEAPQTIEGTNTPPNDARAIYGRIIQLERFN